MEPMMKFSLNFSFFYREEFIWASNGKEYICLGLNHQGSRESWGKFSEVENLKKSMACKSGKKMAQGAGHRPMNKIFFKTYSSAGRGSLCAALMGNQKITHIL